MKRNVKFKIGDEIVVRTGKYKGKTSTIKSIIKKNDLYYVVCEGINLKVKHVKANPQKSVKGGRETKEYPIPASNISIYNIDEKKSDKIVIKKVENEYKRYYKKTGKEIMSKVTEKK